MTYFPFNDLDILLFSFFVVVHILGPFDYYICTESRTILHTIGYICKALVGLGYINIRANFLLNLFDPHVKRFSL